MKRKSEIHHPYDFSFKMMDTGFPKEFHELMGLPGIFVRTANVKVFTKDQRKMEMDSAAIINPDFKRTFERMVLIHEHQSTPISPEKSEIIGEYALLKILEEGLPVHIVISTNTDIEKSQKEFKKTPSMKFEFEIIEITEEDNRERLNRIIHKFNTNQPLNTYNVLELGIIALYVRKEYAKERLKKVVELFSKLTDLPQKLKSVVYSVLYAMIDAHFDDEDEFQMMIDMLNQETIPEGLRDIPYIMSFQEKLSEFEAKQLESEKKIAELEADKIESEKKISEFEAKQLESEKKIAELEADKIESEKKISEFEAEIRILKQEKKKEKSEENAYAK